MLGIVQNKSVAHSGDSFRVDVVVVGAVKSTEITIIYCDWKTFCFGIWFVSAPAGHMEWQRQRSSVD